MKSYQEEMGQSKTLSYYLKRSTFVHVALFACTLISGKIIISQQEHLREKNMELIQSSVRVDMVAMPKYTLNELKNLSKGAEDAQKATPKEVVTPTQKAEIKVEQVEKPIEKEETKPDPTVAFEEANKQKRQDFLSKLKQIGNKKITTNGNQKIETGLHGEKTTALKQLVLSGNKLSKGTQMYGEGNASNMTAFQTYAAKLPDLVRPRWKLPTFLQGKKLKCRVRVWIAMNGDVTRVEIYQTSGDSEFDKRAVDAVKASSPFPRLTEEFAKRALNGDIGLGFPL